jgi:AhpC/TSA family protein
VVSTNSAGPQPFSISWLVWALPQWQSGRMPLPNDAPSEDRAGPGRFQTKHWSAVLAAGDTALPGARKGLEQESFRRDHPDVEVVMISKGEPGENRAKVKEHRLTFPVVLQQQWEISRQYALFATPVAYLIDETGIVAADVAVGHDAILDLLRRADRFI